MLKEEIAKIIDLLSGAGYEVESISVDKFPKPPSGTFFVRFNKRAYPKKKKQPKIGQ
jgi:hypothetical protein